MSKDLWHAIAVQTSPQVRGLLQTLVNTGLYGTSIEEAARYILFEYLRGAILEKTDDKLRNATFWLGKTP
jgi:hypothetical protein